ncbi:MAG: hypothetical protein JXA57_04530 [Armatimonadetes bacterium]|nr:hypothetical protein [Armatimonadota bacterium]
MSSASSAITLRPMGLLEMVDQTFRLYRRHFGVFFGIAAVVYVPWGVLQGVPGVAELAGILLAPFMLVTQGALTKAVSDRYLGEPLSVGEAYRYIGRRFWPLVLTMILAYLMVAAGFLLLIIPGIIFSFWIALTAQVFVIEDKRYSQAIWRSKFLIGEGTWAELIVLMLMITVLTGIIQIVLGALVGVSTFWASQEPAALPLHAAILFGLLEALVMPLTQIAMVLLYYDSRIRKEGFDIQILAKEMGVTLPPAEDQRTQSGQPESAGSPAQESEQPLPPPPGSTRPDSVPETGTDQGGA